MNLSALGYALASSASWGCGDFLSGVKARSLGALQVLVPMQAAGLALTAVVLAARGRGWPGTAVLWALPSALAGTLGWLAFLRAMRAGSMSVVAPIAGTAAVVPVVFGVATGDRLGTLTATGITCAISGVVLASRERSEAGGRVAGGAGWALLAALGWGLYFPPLHAAAQADPYWAVFLFRCTSTAVALAALAASREALPPARQLPTLMLIGFLDVGGNLLYALASSADGLVSVVSVLASLYPIVTVALATLVLRERPSAWQWAGVALTFAGIGLIAAG